MTPPAADLPESLAVLVLAWDEAAPAVRALVAATQASAPSGEAVLVLVPQAAAPAPLSAEENRPQPPLPGHAAPPAAAEPPMQPAVPAEAAPPAAASPATLPAAVPAPSLAPAAGPSPPSLAGPACEAAFEAAATPALAAPPPPGWAAVRVLRLGSHSVPQLAQRAGQPLPAPIWTGAAHLPAVPYRGATPLAPAPQAAATAASQPAAELPAPGVSAPAAATAVAAPEPPQAATAAPGPRPAAAAEPLGAALPAAVPAYAAEPQPQAALETDWPSGEDEGRETVEAFDHDDLRSEEPLLLPGTAQAGWPEALAALRQPAALATPAQAAQAEPTPSPPASAPSSPTAAALHPVATQYPAPDLNFQVIQYARFAVPVALAEPGFVAIYAPAWPTWLAAQELRQRTGRPLVLHVATLAAATEPLATATGWMAELQRQALLRADLILTETPALAARLRHELGLPAGLVQAIAAADATAIAQALHTARPRPAAGQR